MKALDLGSDYPPLTSCPLDKQVLQFQLLNPSQAGPGALPLTSQAPVGTNSPWVHISLSCMCPRYFLLHSWLEMTFIEAT